MPSSLILTISAHDRPGIMSQLSNTIADGGGNWLESRMARLAGQFAGIVRVECSSDQASTLQSTLEALSCDGINVTVLSQDKLTESPYTRCLQIDIFGNDRPGIVSQLTQAISNAGGNIEELNTSIESAAMSGHPIFHASGTVCLPDNTDDEILITAVENLSDDLNVEIGQIS